MRKRGVAVKWCGRIVKVYTVNLHSRPKSGATLNGLAAVPGVGTAPTYDPPHRCSPTSPHDSRPEREREHKLQHQSRMSPSVGAVGKLGRESGPRRAEGTAHSKRRRDNKAHKRERPKRERKRGEGRRSGRREEDGGEARGARGVTDVWEHAGSTTPTGGGARKRGMRKQRESEG